MAKLLKWLVDELTGTFRELNRRELWAALALLGCFGALGYLVGQYAFRTDSVLRSLGHSGTCRELSNLSVVFLFCGMIFSLLAIVVTFGELQRYFEARQHANPHEARQALIQGVIWGVVATGIVLGALMVFNTYCR